MLGAKLIIGVTKLYEEGEGGREWVGSGKDGGGAAEGEEGGKLGGGANGRAAAEGVMYSAATKVAHGCSAQNRSPRRW